MRVRLINPFLLELAQLDTAGTANTRPGGYDDVFREPKPVVSGFETLPARQEQSLFVKAQIDPKAWEALRMRLSGNDKASSFTCVVHFQELEQRRLIDETGLAMIRVGDRLATIYENTPARPLVMEIPPIPGLYVRSATPMAFGIGRKRNLLQLDFQSRDQSA